MLGIVVVWGWERVWLIFLKFLVFCDMEGIGRDLVFYMFLRRNFDKDLVGGIGLYTGFGLNGSYNYVLGVSRVFRNRGGG